MRLIIHDLGKEEFHSLFPKELSDTKVISNDGTIKHCIGCFGCWIKTPGACVIRDNYGDMGKLFSKSDEIFIISKCCYGGFSPFIKNVLDRAISYVHPNLVIRKGEMHHKRRYENKLKFKIYFYGEDITEREIETARKLLKGNAINYDSDKYEVTFVKNMFDMEGKFYESSFN